MTRDEYLLLFEKYLENNATEEEIAALMLHKDDFELVDIPVGGFTKDDRLANERILKKINESTGYGRVSKFRIGVKWYAAAAILIVFTASLILWKGYNKHSSQQLSVKNVKNDIGPGGDKAILTLANGKQIVLTSAGNGTLARQGNVSIKKQKNGTVQYVIAKDAANRGNENTEIGWNTIATPRGGEYNIVLPDGSVVWLNAASSIRFPTTFTGHERRVELTGEAYFEVAKNKNMPFKVKFKDQEVEVLGTHFDIKAYSDDEDSKTTLLEGSVKISKSNSKQLMVPGEQVISYASESGFKIEHPNLQEVMAWKNGFFIFHDVGIQSVMKQAARWYDVNVVYQGDMTDKEYGGRISKYKNISELLKNLELTGTIHFKIDGRRVTVMQ